jgi:hypothetical protein
MTPTLRALVETLADEAFEFLREADKHVRHDDHGCPTYRERGQALYAAIQATERALHRERVDPLAGEWPDPPTGDIASRKGGA